ncbi:MAG TPA: DUF3048 C-terminal domain-containing protein [Jatrophihabitans sp.]|nr:DUF3048 C-terminal domain-containing protein [Jatrophihabitans sp.]
MTTPSRPRRALAAAAVLTVATLLFACAACSSDHKKKAEAVPTSPPQTATLSSPTPTPKPKPKPPAPRNPYTDIGGVPTNPVVAVKIDDTAAGRPQRGIDLADVVYIEAVEGGLTRLAAIYATHLPTVGYVRSTRPSDPDLLLQYGKITEAYSGGAHDSLPRVHRSGITSWSNDAGAAFYARAPHYGDHGYINLVLNLSKVAHTTKTTRPRSIGWTFTATYAGLPVTTGTSLRTVVRGSNAAGTPVEFRYDARLRKYVRYIDGVRQRAADGQPVAATNVIVQQCRVVAHPADSDVLGNPSQFTYTVGRGAVSVFRQGKRINGTWTRPYLTSGTTLRTAAGKPLPLAPGNTWVVLVTNRTPVRS